MYLTSRSALGTIEVFDSNGSSAGSYAIPASAAQQPVTISAADIRRVVVNTTNGGTFLHQFCFSPTLTSFQAGIAAIYVTGLGGITASISTHLANQANIAPVVESAAARIANNEVLCPLGQALAALAIGAVSVHGNYFTSQGFFNQPYLATAIPTPLGQGIDFNQLLEMTGILCINNLGKTLDAPATFFAGVTSTNAGTVNPGALYRLPDGRVLFHDNQVMFLDPNQSDQKTTAGHIPSILGTFGDLSIQDNQVRLINSGEKMLFDLGAIGATLRASGNRFEEIRGQVLCSYSSFATTMNTTTNNQATHCFCTSVQSTTAGGNPNYIQQENLTITPCP